MVFILNRKMPLIFSFQFNLWHHFAPARHFCRAAAAGSCCIEPERNMTMIDHPSALAHASEDPEDVELFCLELDHQVQTTIKPVIKAELDRRQKIFDATIRCLAKPAPKNGASKSRRKRKDRSSGKRTVAKNRVAHRDKRTKRRRPKAKPAFVRDLAVRLAKRWQAPLVIDPRLKSAG